MVVGVRKKINRVSGGIEGSNLDRLVREGFSTEMQLEARSLCEVRR